jgi:hypothetical protein
MKVLVVEDDKTLLELLCKKLKKTAFCVKVPKTLKMLFYI